MGLAADAQLAENGGVIEVDALAYEAIVFEQEEEGGGHFHRAAGGSDACPYATLSSAKDALHDHGVVGVAVGAFAQPEVGECTEQGVEESIDSGSGIDDSAQRRNIVLGMPECSQCSSHIVVDRLGPDVRFDDGFAARAQGARICCAHLFLLGRSRDQHIPGET